MYCTMINSYRKSLGHLILLQVDSCIENITFSSFSAFQFHGWKVIHDFSINILSQYCCNSTRIMYHFFAGVVLSSEQG